MYERLHRNDMVRLFHRIKKNRIISIAAISSIAAGFIVIFIGMVLYKNRIADISTSDTGDYKNYQYHYAIISEEADAPFWEAVYEGAFEKGKEEDIYVEKIGSDLSIAYSLEDLLQIAIASKMDGIIIEPNGDEKVTELINEADKAGIPVVTVLRDTPESGRRSFVGINSYNQGQIYGKQVLEVIDEGKSRITVLMNSDSKDAGTNIIYSSILEMVGQRDVEVESAIVNTRSTFSLEEDIRNIIMDNENPPDTLVCLTAIDTLCAYQAVVDYNKVGDIDIIGYYDSEMILSAIDKNIIHSTLAIDARQMGAYCVEAMTEYRETGQVSDYFSVDINIINDANVKEYME